MLVAFSLLLLGCSALAAPPAGERLAQGAAIRTAQAQRGEISGSLTFQGELRPRGQQTLTAQVAGRVDRVFVDLGSTVQEGQTLVELDRSDFELRVAQQQAAVATAEARLATLTARAQPEAAEQAEAMLRGARARLEALERAAQRDVSPDDLLSQVQAARQRVTQLETRIAQADAAVAAARVRLDQLLRDPNVAQNQAALAEARQALKQAEDAATAAHSVEATGELSQARQELANAQDRLLLARAAVSQADIDAARAAVQAAEIAAKQAGSQPSDAELRAAQAELQRAQAELEVARREAGAATVVAPISGVVSELFVLQGTLVAPGAPLLTIIPPNYEVVVSLPEGQVGQVAAGQPVRVGVDAYPDEEFTGAVRSIAPVVDPRTRTVAARIEVADPGFKLKAGMFAQVALSLAPKRGALLVPKEAVVAQGGENVVFQVIDGRARRQPVQAGVADGRNIEIVSGLAEGAEVVVSPAGQVDGIMVR